MMIPYEEALYETATSAVGFGRFWSDYVCISIRRLTLSSFLHSRRKFRVFVVVYLQKILTAIRILVFLYCNILYCILHCIAVV